MTSASVSSCNAARWLRDRIEGRNLIAVGAMLGGMLVLVGVPLPWFSLFAGLQDYRGTAGVNGWMLAVGGAIGVLAGASYLKHENMALHWSIGLLGFLLLAFSSYLLLQLYSTYRTLASDPMMVANLEIGLFIVVVGAFLLFATLYIRPTRKP